MASRNFYLQIILRIFLIIIFAFGIAFLFEKKQYLISIFVLILVLLQGVLLVNYVNYTNRKIASFFNAITNKDFTLHFPEKNLIKSFKSINQSLNRVNKLIQEEHIKKQEQEHYYQAILKQANIGILVFNVNGHIIFSNPIVEKLLNYSPLNHIKQLAKVDSKLYGLFDGLKPFDQKLFQLSNEREKTQLAIKATTINIDKEKLLLVVIQDIYKELDEKETDSWTRLIRVLTHEIMNTITPITSISESIIKYFLKENKLINTNELNKDHIKNTVKGLEVIKNQGNDLMSFVQSYRKFLNIPLPEKEIVSAYKLLERVKVLMNLNNKSNNVTFNIEISPKNLEFFVDKKQIIQVLMNLSKNAYESLASVNNLKIIKISAGINKAKKKYIEVTDNGIGISKELLDEVFVPFFSTKKTGTGIGLSLSKQILRLHGGTIKVHSIPNKETSFMIIF